MKKQIYQVNSINSLDTCISQISAAWNEHKWLEVTAHADKNRTNSQNSALHVYCELLAKALNDSGQPLVINISDKEVEIDWTMQLVKDCIWRVIQRVVTKKESSAN